MRNLDVVRRRRAQVRLQDEEDEIVGAAVDSEHDRLFFLTRCSKLYWLLHGTEEDEQQWVCLAEDVPAAVAGMEYMVEAEAIVIGLHNGDLLQVCMSPMPPSVQLVGSMDGGMLCMGGSPDGELLAVVTASARLLLITPSPDWDTLLDLPLAPYAYHPSSARLAWRGDAKYLATSDYSPKAGCVIKVWERETGKLTSSFSPPPATSSLPLAWCSTRLAVGGQQDDGSPAVFFLERNGLLKDSLQLPLGPGARIESLQWDASGQVMQVLCRGAGAGWDAVQMWSCSNYHWYLKQERRHAAEERVRVAWHPDKALLGMSWSRSGREVEVTALAWTSAVVQDGAAPVALVIDGPSLLLTPLDLCLLPPPMFRSKITFPAPINTATLAAATVAAGLSDGSLAMAATPAKANVDAQLVAGFNALVRKLIAVSANTLYCLVSKQQQQEEVVQVKVSQAGAEWRLDSLLTVALGKDKSVAALARGQQPDAALVQLDDGSVVEVGADGAPAPLAASFPSACPWMQSVRVSDECVRLVGLDLRGRLYVGSTLISGDCTSFALHLTRSTHVAHLVYTTRQEQLHIVNITSTGSVLLEVADKTQDLNVQRVWERGARIVTTLGGGNVAVILQTSRGNLETVYPRGLILEAVAAMLADRLFREAILCARRHRIDLNVIVDFVGAGEFSRLASHFVQQVGKLSLVTELVSSLRGDNVLQATYRKTLSSLGIASGTASGTGDKVRVVLEALRRAVEKDMADTPSRELCMLTILARSDPPLLEEALQRIKRLREVELGDEQAAGEAKLSAEAAVKHLIWLADEKAVFDAALGVYDLHLAAMVASSCQRDPKEFLPLLEELQDMPAHLMRYTIDCKLRRYGSALVNLGQGQGQGQYFELAVDLVGQHPDLFPLALSLFAGKEHRPRLMEAWGDSFVAHTKYEDAAICYMSCSQLDKAMSAYRGGGLWQGVLTVAGQMNMSGEKVSKLAIELVEELQAMGRPREAARVALDYCNDLEGCVSLLSEARDWREALRHCYLRNRQDLVHKLLLPSAVDCCTALTAQLEEGMDKVAKYSARFAAVHQRRLLLEAKLKGEAEERDDDDDDTASQASSVVSNLSGMSAYSHGTARTSTASSRGRNRGRRQGKIRAGSPGEEAALVEHLKSMAVSAELGEELTALLQALVVMGREDMSCGLQRVASEFEAAQAEAMRAVGEKVAVGGAAGRWAYQALERA